MLNRFRQVDLAEPTDKTGPADQSVPADKTLPRCRPKKRIRKAIPARLHPARSTRAMRRTLASGKYELENRHEQDRGPIPNVPAVFFITDWPNTARQSSKTRPSKTQLLWMLLASANLSDLAPTGTSRAGEIDTTNNYSGLSWNWPDVLQSDHCMRLSSVPQHARILLSTRQMSSNNLDQHFSATDCPRFVA